MASPAVTSPRFSRPQLLGLVVLLMTLVAFRNSLDGAFLFDDFDAIHNNLGVHQLWPPWTALSPPRDTTIAGRPLVSLSLAVNYAINGAYPRGYHIFNLAVHSIAALLLYGLIRRMLSNPRVPEALRRDSDVVAALAAMLWAVHPLQTESVTYVIQRAESMCGMAYLLTLYSFVRSATAISSQRGWSVLCVIACAVGMACKEVMVTAPLMVLFIDRALYADSFKQGLLTRWRLYAGLAATWLILALLLAGSPRPASTGSSLEFGPLDYLRTQAGVILHYLRLSLWPDPLMLDYSWPISPSWRDALPALAAIGAMLAATIIAWIRWPLIALPAVAFFLLLGPSSSFYPIADIIFEHRMYLALAPVMVGATLLIHTIAIRILKTEPMRAIQVTSVVCAAAAVALMVRTIFRNQQYADPIELWKANLIDGETYNARAMCNLGGAYLAAGRAREASDACLAAIKVQPGNPEPYVNLSAAYLAVGEIDHAIWAGERSLEANPNLSEAHYNLGMAFKAAGRRREAEEQLKTALTLRPWSARIRESLAHLDEPTSVPSNSSSGTHGAP